MTNAQPAPGTAITWASLLSHWTALAQASLALPPTALGERWKAAVAPIVGLQAVTHALADLAPLPGEDPERALGLDKAELLIKRHAGELASLWERDPLPEELLQIISDARAAFHGALAFGVEWLAPATLNTQPPRPPVEPSQLEHPAELVESLAALEFSGDLLLASAGIRIMPGAPIAFARAHRGGAPPARVVRLIGEFLRSSLDCPPLPRPIPGPPRQVYRQFDFTGSLPKSAACVRRDLVAPLSLGPQAGQPLLVPVVDRGRPCAVALPPPPGALDRLGLVPVEFMNEPQTEQEPEA